MTAETRALAEDELRRIKVIMSWSTTQRAIFNRMGRMALFTTDEEQEAYRDGLVTQLESKNP